MTSSRYHDPGCLALKRAVNIGCLYGVALGLFIVTVLS